MEETCGAGGRFGSPETIAAARKRERDKWIEDKAPAERNVIGVVCWWPPRRPAQAGLQWWRPSARQVDAWRIATKGWLVNVVGRAG